MPCGNARAHAVPAGLDSLEKRPQFQVVEFTWDETKNAANLAKHGLSLAQVVALWDGPVVSLPSRRPGEERHLAIGLLAGRHWTVIYTPRAGAFRLISARRSHPNEEKLHRHHFPQP